MGFLSALWADVPRYRFDTLWRFEAGIHEVADVLADVDALPRWWPAVYLDVDVVRRGPRHGPGWVARMVTRGWLPYTLRWTCRVVAADYPHGFVIEADGDLDGRGEWRLEADDTLTRVTFDWDVSARQPVIRHFSFAFREVFAANHRWAMARGHEGMRRELARRRLEG